MTNGSGYLIEDLHFNHIRKFVYSAVRFPLHEPKVQDPDMFPLQDEEDRACIIANLRGKSIDFMAALRQPQAV